MQVIKITVAVATIFGLWVGAQAHAERSESGNSDKQWFTMEGKPLSAREANTQKGKFLQCSVVEVVVNDRTGKSSIKK